MTTPVETPTYRKINMNAKNLLTKDHLFVRLQINSLFFELSTSANQISVNISITIYLYRLFWH